MLWKESFFRTLLIRITVGALLITQVSNRKLFLSQRLQLTFKSGYNLNKNGEVEQNFWGLDKNTRVLIS